MKPFRIGTMCQLIEIICHTTQFADEVCLLYGQSFNNISFIKNFSYKLTRGYYCAFGFAFERIVILRIQFHRDTVFFLSKHKLIYSYLDNDEGGKRTLEQLKRDGFDVQNCSSVFQNYKDLNEYLCAEFKHSEKAENKKIKEIKL